MTTALMRESTAALRSNSQTSFTVLAACCSKNGMGNSIGGRSGMSPSSRRISVELSGTTTLFSVPNLASEKTPITMSAIVRITPMSKPIRNFAIQNSCK